MITPVWNERRHLDVIVDAMVHQSRPPDSWIVVDDGSTDGTFERLLELSDRTPFMRVVRAPRSVHAGARDRLAAGGPPRAFNVGLRFAELGESDFVAKIDGDIELPPNYFATLLERFEADRQLGMASGHVVEPRPGGRWRRVGMPSHHVAGPIKLYSAACFEDIGGVPDRLGWDTIDEVRAQMRGYSTRSWRDLVVRHHRPTGGVDGVVRGHARHGACAWINHYPLGFVLLRALKLTAHAPRGPLGIAFVFGYLHAAARRVPQVDDPAFRAWIRGDLRKRVAQGVKQR